MGKPDFKIRALGEIAIRCHDVGAMMAFYRDVIGLELLEGGHRGDIVFFNIAPGHGGHTAVLALFPDDGDGKLQAGSRSPLHHFALTVDRADQEAITAHYERIGQAYSIEEFGWIGWRGVFTTDPEGNTVELVAYDNQLPSDTP